MEKHTAAWNNAEYNNIKQYLNRWHAKWVTLFLVKPQQSALEVDVLTAGKRGSFYYFYY